MYIEQLDSLEFEPIAERTKVLAAGLGEHVAEFEQQLKLIADLGREKSSKEEKIVAIATVRD